MSKRFFALVFVVFVAALSLFVILGNTKKDVNNNIIDTVVSRISGPTPTPTLAPLPQEHTIPRRLHIFQSFNNCGPASLSMALSYFNVDKSQGEIGNALRPYQIPGGDNDDKSVTLSELASYAESLGLKAYHRPNGNVELLKRLIAMDVPVITRTWTKADEDIGHYRVVRGYNDENGQLIQDDSLQGKDLFYSYEDFNTLWEKFNNEYLAIVPVEKAKLVEQALGENLDEKRAWEKAVEVSEAKLKVNPDDIYSRFNLSIALYNTGDYSQSTKEFEQVEGRLPFRTLWYQIEPVKAYFELGNYTRVFEITDRIINNHNRAYSEAYIIRGDSYLRLGNSSMAREEYEKAVQYNQNLKVAAEKLGSLN